MGIELLGTDGPYDDFIRSFSTEEDSSNPSQNSPRKTGDSTPEVQSKFTIVACGQCGVRNKVKTEKLHLGPRCGKCGNALATV